MLDAKRLLIEVEEKLKRKIGCISENRLCIGRAEK